MSEIDHLKNSLVLKDCRISELESYIDALHKRLAKYQASEALAEKPLEEITRWFFIDISNDDIDS
jgi:hypothetical protein